MEKEDRTEEKKQNVCVGDEEQDKEYDDKKLNKREEIIKLLVERRKRSLAVQPLYDRELYNDDEKERNRLDELKKQRENTILRRLEMIAQKSKDKGEKPFSVGSSAEHLNPFRLFKLKKLDYSISIQNYFCDMIMKLLPVGEVARFYENFEATLSDTTTTYPNFPILFLDHFRSPSDLKVLLSLIDAQDSGGFTALHWAVHEGNLEQIEMLLANGANTVLRSSVAKHRPIDRADAHPEITKLAIKELLKKYQGKENKSKYKKNTISVQGRSEMNRDTEQFPFLELPTELQILVLEQLTIPNLTRMQRVCKYIREMQMLQRLTELPEMEVAFADAPDYYDTQVRCRLTVMATPTVFHFGLIVGQLYQVPSKRGADRVINEMIGKIEKFAKDDWIIQYDIQKLQKFLLNSWQMKRRIYILEETDNSDINYSLYVEMDAQFGVGVEFKFGLLLDNDELKIYDNDNWNFKPEDYGYYPFGQ